MTAKTLKSLIITEKPSVARDIVQALGGFTPRDGQAYWESDAYLCTFAVGHLFSLLSPEDLDPAYRSWKLSLLPILPAAFRLKPIEGHERRIKIIRELLERSDVNCLINACDAAREGELIFREIVVYHDCQKWVRRLWLQSMTPEAIRSGFAALKDGTDLKGLGDAAECRARADWLIGMNATRAFSERLRHRGERTPWSVGRVQTPTLALLVERELKILAHVPKPFFRVAAQFHAKDHDYEGTWFDPRFKADELRPELKDDRVFGRDAAERILEETRGKSALAAETREESLRHAPYLFNLTGLQKYMATRYKFNSKRTLEAAQRCYEQHKVLTYPRTNSSCLPSDYRGEVDRLVEGLVNDPTYGEAARYLQANGRRNEKRTFNDQGVDDHFAIIPTGKSRSLGGDDAKVYDAVVRRFLATFMPPAVYDKVKRTTVVAGHHFRTGPVETLIVPGWLAVYDKKASEAGEAEAKLPPLVAGAKKAQDVPVRLGDGTLKEDVTKPPSRINEAGLLTLMEHAGRHVENEELAQALMSAEGLGTAATRADIIQNLKAKEYIDESLRPTFKGIHLITTLQRVKAERLTSPELTARLELELAEVEQGKRQNKTFMDEIARYTSEIVEIAKTFDLDRLYASHGPLGPCPQCQKHQVRERALEYACGALRSGPGIPEPGCGYRLAKEVAGRYLDPVNAALLLTDGETPELDGFRRGGKDFKARLKLEGGGRLTMVDAAGARSEIPVASPAGGMARDNGRGNGRAGGSSAPSAGPRTPVGLCPMHRDQSCHVVEAKSVYVCETRLKQFAAGEKQPVGIMIPKVLCQREMREADVTALLERGRTDELAGFVSKAGRPFQAALSLRPDGGCAFEFASASPREATRAPARQYPPRGNRTKAKRAGRPAPEADS